MDYFAKLVIAALAAFFTSISQAGYAQLAPPPGWSSAPGATGWFNYGQAANNAKWLANGTVATNASLSVGGQVAKFPVGLKYAANASRFASAFIFANPYLRAGVAVAAWLSAAGVIWDASRGVWRINDEEPIKGKDRYWFARDGQRYYFDDVDSLCAAGISLLDTVAYVNKHTLLGVSGTSCLVRAVSKGNPRDFYEFSFPFNVEKKEATGVCPDGWIKTDMGCLGPALPQPDFVEELEKTAMPLPVPKELPTPLPVTDPDIDPGPVFIPTGDPVPNPNFDPSKAPSPENAPYIKPGIKAKPSPTPEDPWRVDLQPVNRPSVDGKPSTGPEPYKPPSTSPGGAPGDSGGSPGDKAPSEKPGLCDEYPDILACAKMNEPQEKDLEEIKKDIQISPDSGWGADNASCPAPKQIHPMGRTIMIPYDLFCMYMQGLRPIIIAMAWLSAAFILIGARESS